MDAAGIHDNILADEIGLVLYIRCKLGKEDMERMEQSIIRCHNCNANISGTSDFRECTCGYQYSFRGIQAELQRKNNHAELGLPTKYLNPLYQIGNMPEFIMKKCC